ncbi:hypothetical protein N7509_009503 [Penicillium cosmopolitanum]|uniref:Uncharacterized protein n=1 Tax=Penicillium cosmopolitanum TaxID=1131564 RepID=A0A9X0B3Q0_9EURO|nr:uncharacterized protein N7509_009503 [Penicillium cosmopolitanum]KAJ5386962.1 hypothetical protein N7509_009503 [Penicillium cosmopolitanum]
MLNDYSLPSTTSIAEFTVAQLGTSTAASLVAFTSFLTETIHPVLTYTEQTTISNDPVTQFVTSQLVTTTNLDTVQSVSVTFSTLSQTHLPETPWAENTQSETQLGTTQQTFSPISLTSSVPSWTTDTSISPSSESQAGPSLVGLTDPNPHTSEAHPMPLVPITPTSIRPSSASAGAAMTTHSLSQSPVSRSDPGLQMVTSGLEGTSTQSSSTLSTPTFVTTATSSSPVGGHSGGSSDDNYRKASHTVGTIVGCVVGGMAVSLLAILACILFVRRRRRNSLHRRLHSRQTLLRSDSDNSGRAFLDGHNPQPSWPIQYAGATTTSESFSAPARKLSGTGTGPNYGLSAANKKLALDSYTQNEHSIGAPWASSSRRPTIEVSPPSRSASIYSRQSWEDRLESLEFYHNGEFTLPDTNATYHHGGSVEANRDRAAEISNVRNLAHGCRDGMGATDTYYPSGESTTTLPEVRYKTPGTKHLATPKRRASIRSNPFDLEFPPSAASKGPEFDTQLPPPASAASWEYPEPGLQHPHPPTEFPNSPWGGRY